jgi:hypothetical protein
MIGRYQLPAMKPTFSNKTGGGHRQILMLINTKSQRKTYLDVLQDPTTTINAYFLSVIPATCPAHLILLDFITRVTK